VVTKTVVYIIGDIIDLKTKENGKSVIKKKRYKRGGGVENKKTFAKPRFRLAEIGLYNQ
jgi:hypothetical protein